MVRIALVQQAATEDREANIEKGLANLAEAARRGATIACFAEIAFDRFHPQEPPQGDPARLAETVPGPTTGAFQAAARRLGVVTVLNLYEKEGEKTFDTSPVIDADGALLGKTRMVHVPDYPCFHERRYYHPGDLGAPVFDTAAGRIGVAICYDRHFPEYMRALALGGADLVLVPQAGAVDEWPAGLFEAELQVASFQNGYFAALANRVGKERCIEFAGESFVTDPAGVVVARAGKGTEEILVADLDLGAAGSAHARQLFLADRRPALYPPWLA